MFEIQSKKAPRQHNIPRQKKTHIFIAPSPCAIFFPTQPCPLLSQSKVPWKVFCPGQLEGGFKTILLHGRESALSMGLERGSGAVKQGRNSSAALPWPAKKKFFPSPCRDLCLGRVWTPGRRRTARSPRGHSGKRLGTVQLCSA